MMANWQQVQVGSWARLSTGSGCDGLPGRREVWTGLDWLFISARPVAQMRPPTVVRPSLVKSDHLAYKPPVVSPYIVYSPLLHEWWQDCIGTVPKVSVAKYELIIVSATYQYWFKIKTGGTLDILKLCIIVQIFKYVCTYILPVPTFDDFAWYYYYINYDGTILHKVLGASGLY